MSDDTIHLVAGIDVGNGYVKGLITNTGTGVTDEIDMPSAATSQSGSTPRVPEPDASAADLLGPGSDVDFYNRLDASIDSPLVSRADRKIFGRASLSVRGSGFSEFEVMGPHSKAEQELSKVLVLGTLAVKVLRDHVAATGELPSGELAADVHIGLALPIAEFVAKRHSYAAAFTGTPADPVTHLVTIKNFSTPVRVRLSFIGVQVMAEGASAQFAITDLGEPLAAGLLADLRSREFDALPGVSPADLVAVRNTIGVDVGEGTVNLPTFTDGRFNAEASATLGQGYGTALTNAMARMETADPPLQFASRKQLAAFLTAAPSALQRGRHDRAAGFVTTEAGYLVEEIVSSFTDVLSQAGATTEAVYVYGGGAGPIKDQLYPALAGAAGDIPVLYLDSAYSRNLNRQGLFLAAQAVAAATGAPTPIRTAKNKKHSAA